MAQARRGRSTWSGAPGAATTAPTYVSRTSPRSPPVAASPPAVPASTTPPPVSVVVVPPRSAQRTGNSGAHAARTSRFGSASSDSAKSYLGRDREVSSLRRDETRISSRAASSLLHSASDSAKSFLYLGPARRVFLFFSFLFISFLFFSFHFFLPPPAECVSTPRDISHRAREGKQCRLLDMAVRGQARGGTRCFTAGRRVRGWESTAVLLFVA